MTMHSAKGLQYPAVAVLGLTEGQMPWHARGGEHPIELNHKLRRLFYVACTRSMSRLLVIGGKNNQTFSARNYQRKLDSEKNLCHGIDYILGDDHCLECWQRWCIIKQVLRDE